jgi:hypothetical protein
MTELSPAAEAVLDAALPHMVHRYSVAAAIRAAANQVMPEQVNSVGDEHDEARRDQWTRIRLRFLAIADELEAQ